VGASPRYEAGKLQTFVEQVFLASGVNRPSAEAAARSLLHGSRVGLDSHGIRLISYHLSTITKGEVNRNPVLTIQRVNPSVSVVDADNAIGHLACYTAMEEATRLATEQGVGAVTIKKMSNIGAAGAYVLWAAERGFIGLVAVNVDALVSLFDGKDAFHGTNPLAVSAPVPGQRPWLLDMATSAVPINKILFYRSLGLPLPAGVAVDAMGQPTTDANAACTLQPLGGEQGYKGAGLAGLIEILSAPLTGMSLSTELHQVPEATASAPRNMGGFVLALNPSSFIELDKYNSIITRYLDTLRSSRPAAGASGKPMAPGDREWEHEADRIVNGIPIDASTLSALTSLAKQYSIPLPDPVGRKQELV
jgi:LDH2 family malate/lactate/ureidoglycolate dehydrogenase